jgi:hypothetical protein
VSAAGSPAISAAASAAKFRPVATRARLTQFRFWRVIALVALPFALGGCLTHEPESLATEANPVATVPARFFTATVVALPPSAPPQGRYTLEAITSLDAADPANTYTAALLQPETKGVRLSLRVDGLPAPTLPLVSYELLTTGGVYRPLADGEWDRASPQVGGWSASGTLIFLIPRDLHAGQLAVVDYYYPQSRPDIAATPGPLAPLVRRTLATFILDHLP